jgi:anti-sigma-K factor RskA
MNTEEYIASGILELYVSGTLSEEEGQEVERMAQAYSEVQDELLEIEESLLKLSALHASKSDKDKTFHAILDKIKHPEAITVPISPELKGGGHYEEDNIIPLHPFHEKQRQRYISLMVAAVALFMISSLLNVYFFTQWKHTQSDYTALKENTNAVAKQYNEASQRLSAANKELLVYHSPDMKVIMLEPLKKGMQYKAMAMWNPKMKTLEIKAMGLPAPPEGKQYQLWAIDDNKPVDAGMLVDLSKLEPMKNIGSAQAFAITLEQAGGSPTPTMSAMVVMGKVENI